MNSSAMFQPEWNRVQRRQFRHMEVLRRMTKSSGDGEDSFPVEDLTRGECICLECGREFGVQREGAMYMCERCTAKAE